VLLSSASFLSRRRCLGLTFYNRKILLAIVERNVSGLHPTVFPDKLPVGSDFEAPLFSVALDRDFVVPPAIHVVFPFHPDNFSTGSPLLDRLLNARWQ